MRRIGAAHIERVGGAVGPVHAEPRQKFFHDIEIGRTQASIRDIGDFGPSHVVPPELDISRRVLRNLPRSARRS